MCKEIRQCRVIISVVTLGVCMFDLGSDWFIFAIFTENKTEANDVRLTLALLVLCVVSSVMFLLEVRNSIVGCRIFSKSPETEDEEEVMTKAERSLERWHEVVTFFQLMLEDFPLGVILYVTFTFGSCPLYISVFDESFTGNLGLLASFVGAIWRLLTAFFYCCCGGCRRGAMCDRSCCCCCQRVFRAMVALLLCAFTAYLFFTFNANYTRGETSRTDCVSRNQSASAIL